MQKIETSSNLKGPLNSKKRRVALLDEVRGLCILGVVVFHGLYDLVELYGVNIPLFDSWFIGEFIQPLGAGAFIFISGVVSRYSRSNLSRGLKTLGIGTGISIITSFILPTIFPGLSGIAIRFGVLSLLGSGMILYGLLEKYAPSVLTFSSTSHKPAVVGLLLFLAFAFTFSTPQGTLGFFKTGIFTIPQTPYNLNLYFLGFPSLSFVSSDYFPLLPWLFLFLSGSYLGVYFVQDRVPEWFYTVRRPLLSRIGHYSLPIYVLHQPILMGLFMLIFR